jgi:hypothetical protein
VLCSDGLTDLVTKEEILRAIQSRERNLALGYLIDLANSRGGHDNITVIFLELPPDDNLTQPIQTKDRLEKKPRELWLRNCLGILLLMALLTLLGVLLWRYLDTIATSRPTPTPSPVGTRRVTPVFPGSVRTTPTATSKFLPSPTPRRVPPNPPPANTDTPQVPYSPP